MSNDNCKEWREKLEQLKANGRIAIEAGEKMIEIIRHERDDALQQLAAKDQEIARLREALQEISKLRCSPIALTVSMANLADTALAATAQTSSEPCANCVRLREVLERMSVYHTDQCESLIEPEGTYPCTCGKRDADAALAATAQPSAGRAMMKEAR